MRERHFHTTVEALVVGAIGVAVTFHAIRFVAAQLAKRGGTPGKVGAAIGGVFSFPASV